MAVQHWTRLCGGLKKTRSWNAFGPLVAVQRSAFSVPFIVCSAVCSSERIQDPCGNQLPTQINFPPLEPGGRRTRARAQRLCFKTRAPGTFVGEQPPPSPAHLLRTVSAPRTDLVRHARYSIDAGLRRHPYRAWRTRSVRGALTVRTKCAGDGGGCAPTKVPGVRALKQRRCAPASAHALGLIEDDWG